MHCVAWGPGEGLDDFQKSQQSRDLRSNLHTNALQPLPAALHPGAPHTSVLGITAGVHGWEEGGHRVLVVVLQAGKELQDDVGMLLGQIVFFFGVLIDIKQPDSLGWWVQWTDLSNVGLRWRRDPMTTAWKKTWHFSGAEALFVGSNLKASGGQGCPGCGYGHIKKKSKQNSKPPCLLVLSLDLSRTLKHKLSIAELHQSLWKYACVSLSENRVTEPNTALVETLS